MKCKENRLFNVLEKEKGCVAIVKKLNLLYSFSLWSLIAYFGNQTLKAVGSISKDSIKNIAQKYLYIPNKQHFETSLLFIHLFILKSTVRDKKKKLRMRNFSFLVYFSDYKFYKKKKYTILLGHCCTTSKKLVRRFRWLNFCVNIVFSRKVLFASPAFLFQIFSKQFLIRSFFFVDRVLECILLTCQYNNFCTLVFLNTYAIKRRFSTIK